MCEECPRERKRGGVGGNPWGKGPILTPAFVTGASEQSKGPGSASTEHSRAFSEWPGNKSSPRVLTLS